MKHHPDYRAQQLIYKSFNGAFSKFSSELTTKHGCLIANSDIPHPFFNSILSTTIKNNLKESIQLIKQEFQDKPRCWWVTPFVEPSHLAEELIKNEFTAGDEFAGMIYDLSLLPSSPLKNHPATIKKIDQIEDLTEWMSVLAICFQFSKEVETALLHTFQKLFHDTDLVHYGAYLDNKLVATASLFLQKPICGFYNLGVLPEYRQQKIALLLKWYRLKMAKELGYECATLQSSKAGVDLDKSIGFQEKMKFIPYLL